MVRIVDSETPAPVSCDASMGSVRQPSASRSIVVVVIAVLALGHACEPALADIGLHVHGAAHHSSHPHDHPSGDGHEADRASCEAVAAAASSNTAPPDPASGSVPDQARAAMGTLPMRIVRSAALEESERPPSGPPLFLLHASLLI